MIHFLGVFICFPHKFDLVVIYFFLSYLMSSLRRNWKYFDIIFNAINIVCIASGDSLSYFGFQRIKSGSDNQ